MMVNNEFLLNLMVHLKYVCPPALLSKTQAPDAALPEAVENDLPEGPPRLEQNTSSERSKATGEHKEDNVPPED